MIDKPYYLSKNLQASQVGHTWENLFREVSYFIVIKIPRDQLEINLLFKSKKDRYECFEC